MAVYTKFYQLLFYWKYHKINESEPLKDPWRQKLCQIGRHRFLNSIWVVFPKVSVWLWASYLTSLILGFLQNLFHRVQGIKWDDVFIVLPQRLFKSHSKILESKYNIIKDFFLFTAVSNYHKLSDLKQPLLLYLAY